MLEQFVFVIGGGILIAWAVRVAIRTGLPPGLGRKAAGFAARTALKTAVSRILQPTDRR